MFYSHEVLTSRKYGVATVWLVATLGSKSNLKKIKRKAIRDVNVPKACKTITDPVAPMALRLQGNLLYGVSRVYLEQCGYVLSDAQNIHNAMRMMLKVVKDAALDPEAGRANPKQLLLQDDPTYLPDFALPPLELLEEFNLPVVHAGESQSLTPFGSQNHAGTPVGQFGGLMIPSSSSGPVGEFNVGSHGAPSSAFGGLHEGTGEASVEPLLEPDFGFDADGNIREFEMIQTNAGKSKNTPGTAIHSDATASTRAGQQHAAGLQAGIQFEDEMEVDLPILGDDRFRDVPIAELQADVQPAEEQTSSALAAAPVRRKSRAKKIISVDRERELGHRDLAEWNQNYLSNMAEANRIKKANRAPAQAKKNADFWLWGSGIGGIGQFYNSAAGPNPLDRFCGDNLFELYTGISRKKPLGKKHDRDSGIDDITQGESRRVKSKHDVDQEVGRAEADDGMFMLGDEEVELPREAPSALDDQQIFSAMPWNTSASARGSSAVPPSGRATMLGSTGRSTGHHGSTLQRGGRTVSASPLHGRGPSGGLEALQGIEDEDELGSFGLEGFDMPPGPSSDGVYLEPEGESQAAVRVREALSAEGENFLAFVTEAIAAKGTPSDAPNDDLIEEVLFEDLLPPAENTRMIACQGLMMVLALGTKGMLSVRQEKAAGEIGLAMTDKARAMQVQVPDIVAEEQPDPDLRAVSHFDEQMAAGVGSDINDDHDSQYDE